MCGIAGAANLEGQTVSAGRLVAMARAIRHRGPDDEGFVFIQTGTGAFRAFCGPDSPAPLAEQMPRLGPGSLAISRSDIALAHRRFAIIDPSAASHQPFLDSARRVALVFNGEIYNYLELAGELRRLGHELLTRGDVEVLAEAWKAWGTECFPRLNGMWALALYDFARRQLVLARDRAGKKPLYWLESGGAIHFASEIKSFIEAGILAPAVDPAAIEPWIAEGLRDHDPDLCFFAGVRSLPAASLCVLDLARRDGSLPRPAALRPQRFWEPPRERLRASEISPKEAAAGLRRRLSRAIALRRRADVPWAIELSGGLDSSAIAALAAEQGLRPVAYTIRFGDADLDETRWAQAVAARFGLEQRFVDAASAEPERVFWAEAAAFTWLEEEPYHSPNLHLNQLARRRMREDGFKMLLSGAAGDELLAGYKRYFAPAQAESILAGDSPRWLSNLLRWSEDHALKGLVYPFALPWQAARARARARRLLAPASLAAAPLSDAAAGRGWRDLAARLLDDFRAARIPYWLRSADKTHMGIPIEARSPFLDVEVVEWCLRLPVGYLIRDGWHKWILRRALADLLPPEVLWRRRKLGLPFPVPRFLERSRPFIEILLRHAENPWLRRDPAVAASWPGLSFLLWHEVCVRRNQPLIEEIAERVQAGPAAKAPALAAFLPRGRGA